MLPETPRKMLEGLVTRLEARSSVGFSGLWVDGASMSRHIERRMKKGEIESAADYEQKTLAVFGQAEQLTVALPKDPKMRSTGKMAMISGEWVVLLSEDGAIVTSYPYLQEFVGFENRHKQAGDQVNEYTIPNDVRASIKALLG